MGRISLFMVPLLALACGGQPTPLPQYGPDTPPVTLAMVVDDVGVRAATAPTADFAAHVGGALSGRGLKAGRLADDEIGRRYSQLRDTDGRLRDVMAQAGAGIAVLVETQAEFYSAISGQHRWTLHVALAVGEAGRGAPIVRRFSLPIVVLPHQQAPAVFSAAGPEVARRLGRLLDDYLGGRTVGTPAAAKAAPAGAQVPTDSSADSIYFVMLDRFENGDLGNDSGADPKDPAAWHGGDLAGLTGKLDYLADLGVKTIWISPIFTSRAEAWMGHGAFHGYWTEDLDQVDPRFGTPADLETLVTAAHGRGMRVLLDFVVNHVGYDTRLQKTQPDWFHTAGTIEDWNDPVQLVEGQVHGLPDLAQEKAEVYAYLLSTARRWARVVDGFRLDAVKHVHLDFWTRFNQTLAAEFPGIVLLGEHYDGDPRAVEKTRSMGGFTQMFDFPLSFALREAFCQGQPVGRIGAVLASDRLYDDPARTLVTFIDNHDLPRVMSICGGELARVRHALTAQFALRGTPAINYGTEAGLEGVEEPANRPDMRFEGAEFEQLTTHLRALHRLREVHPVLVSAQTRVLHLDPTRLVWIRANAQGAVMAVVNQGESTAFDPSQYVEGEFRPLLGAPADRLMAQSTTLFAARGDFSHLAGGHGPMVSVTVEAEAKLEKGQRLRLVGNAPELGAWSPVRGVVLNADGQGRFTGQIDVPSGVVLSYKLVIETGEAQRWESRDNRYYFTASTGVIRPVFGATDPT